MVLRLAATCLAYNGKLQVTRAHCTPVPGHQTLTPIRNSGYRRFNMEITTETILNSDVIDTIARQALGMATSGISTSGRGTRIHLTNDAQENSDKAQAIFDMFGALLISADKTTMNEGDVDPVITCADANISLDANVGYVVLLDGQLYAKGTDVVVAGVVTLGLVAPIAGVYDIFIYRTSGNYASGFIRITVNEV